MEYTNIIKLGGSIITDKQSGQPILRTRRIRQLAGEIAQARKKQPALRLVLLHGAGSFGHPLAHRYRLCGRPLSSDTFVAMGRTINSTRTLGTYLSRELLKADIPVVPLQTSSCVRMRLGRVCIADMSMIEEILKHGGVPLLGGDVVLSDREESAIVSADALVVELARRLDRPRLFFASDVAGVYATFPPRGREHPLERLDRATIQNILATSASHGTRTDVTGAMHGKLQALLALRGVSAFIFNGNSRGSMLAALAGEPMGTAVVL